MDKASFDIDPRHTGDQGHSGLFGGDGADVVLSADNLEFHLEDQGGDHGLFGGDGWDRYGDQGDQKDGLFGGDGWDRYGDLKDGLFGGDGADVVLQSEIVAHETGDASLEVTGLRLDSDGDSLL